MSLLYTVILSRSLAINSILAMMASLSKRTSSFHSPSWAYPPMGPAFKIPDLFVRFRNNVAKARSSEYAVEVKYISFCLCHSSIVTGVF